MDKNEAQKQIKDLILKYEEVLASGRAKKYNEEETKKDFILPLFEALGWNTTDKREVSAEESQSGGRVDYGFYLNDRAKFYLEAKSLPTDLNREEFANQAIRYSWNKGVTWAILTDFESIKVFNAQDVSKYLSDKLFFEIPYIKYLERFDQLWLLSREAFLTDLIDKEAERVGKKILNVSVSATLYKDLNECRNILTQNLSKWNEKVDKNLIDEGVQKILDRLIFLRVAEDRGLEPETLRPLIREWKNRSDQAKVPLYKSMVNKFREFDEIYNSNLFSPHPFEEWDEYSGATEKVVDILYGKKGYYEYDFKVMPADVLGTVYENYLGFKLLQSKKKTTITKDDRKRKEHGIYYTPDFIVEYIVKNALKPVLDKCVSVEELKKIKVLDPACGSGSFLIKAFQLIREKYREFGYKDNNVFINYTILLENIFGVDLDPQAVEIARLNLLISALNERTKLPVLSDNIKNGNSLISGTDEELKKYFGKDYKDKKPFNWEEEFPQVFKQGGFDVIIGNPPYLDSEEMIRAGLADVREYCSSKYTSASGNWDLFCVFIELGIKLLKNKGFLSFIVPNKLISATYATNIRKLLSQNTLHELKDFSNIPVFHASVYPIVFLVEKNKVGEGSSEMFDQKIDKFALGSGNESSLIKNLFDRVKNLNKLGDIAVVKGAATVGEAYVIKTIVNNIDQKFSDQYLKLTNTGTLDKYESLWGIQKTQYLKDGYTKPVVDKLKLKDIFPSRLEESITPKLIVGGMGKEIECFFDSKGEYLAGKSTSIIIPLKKDRVIFRILLGLLNSKLLTKIYSNTFQSLSLSGGYLRIGPPQLKTLPVIIPEGKLSIEFDKLVNKRIDLSMVKENLTENSDEWNKLQLEIEFTDKKIDEEVYKLYGLTPEEINAVETNNNN